MKQCRIDFEFNQSEERFVNPVCCSLWANGKVHEFWLHNDPLAKRELATFLLSMKDTHHMVCFGAIAEVRSFMALGLDPWDFMWIDLYLEWKQVRNENNKRAYGIYYSGFPRQRHVSVPPHINPRMNVDKDNTPLKSGLVAAVAAYYDVCLDSIHKDVMRKLIISDPAMFTPEERKAITEYCTSDLDYLGKLFKSMATEISELTGTDIEEVVEIQANRAKVSVSMALCETQGIPLDWDAVTNLNQNTEKAKEDLIADLVANTYPFFERDPKSGEWKEKATLFAQFVESKGLTATWPRTESGGLARDEEHLKEYDGIPEIYALRQVKKTLNQLKWFRDEAWGYFLEHVGHDRILRTFLAPFGTQTGRNAPQAKTFIPAMSNWLRALIRAPKGYAITGIDWASQEFVIAAVLSGDKVMLEAYNSGDPYLHFAKLSGMVPPEGTKKTHERERDLCKSLVLGQQYGMGAVKLARKLSVDTGRPVSEAEARRLIGLHKKNFHRYWAWQDRISAHYERKPLTLDNGWSLFRDNPRITSVRNFPVQGTGAAIMHKAIELVQKKGVKVLFPLHDAIYILHPVEDANSIQVLQQSMDEAVELVLGTGITVRQDAKTVRWDETWVEKKGQKQYNLLNKYLKPQPSSPQGKE